METMYFAIRKTVDSGKEWADPSTASGLREEAERKARETDKSVPAIASGMPVVRIAEFQITEIAQEKTVNRRGPREPSDRLRDQEAPTVLGYELDRVTLTPVRRRTPK